jgi:SAM-dependent methyltransferase
MGEFERRIEQYSKEHDNNNANIEIKNYDVYIGRMSKSMYDKCWWVDKIDDSITTVLDFGCGDGEMGKFLEHMFPGRFQYIGVDGNAVMRTLANQNLKNHPNFSIIKGLDNAEIDSECTILVLNSVIHEMFTYLSVNDNASIFMKVIDLNPRYVTIRDMHAYPITVFSIPMQKKAVAMLKSINEKAEGAYKDNLIAFIRNTPYKDSINTLLEWVLKYRYIENWQRESKERYLFNWKESMAQMFLSCKYEIVYEIDSFIPFIYDKFEQDFGIKMLPIPSHKKLLIKRPPENLFQTKLNKESK